MSLTLPMRILHIISSVDPRGGGPAEGIRQRGIFLQAQGHQVEVLCADAPDAPHLKGYPLPVHAVGPAHGGYAWAPRIGPWLEKNAATYDAVVVSGLWQYHGLATSRAMRKLGLPYHVFTHGMLDPWFKQTYPLKHLKKWIYWALAEYHVLKHAKAVLFTSEEERLRARESFWLYRVNEEVVDYGTSEPPANGAELKALFQREHPDLAGKHLVLFLSRVHEKKGCDLLVSAFAEAAAARPDLHLVMAGPAAPALKESLQALARRLGVADRISWLGMVNGDAKWSTLYGCDVFILPSHQENFGIAVAEALACGLPVLISDKVNIWREVQADGAGLVQPDTADGTAQLLQGWLATPSAAQAAMQSAARRCYQTRYTVAASAASLLKVLVQADPAEAARPAPGTLRILHVVSSVDPQLGGVAESIRSRGVKLVEMGHTVEVVSMDDPAAPFVASYALKLHALGRGITAWQYHSGLTPWLRANCKRFDAVVVDGIWQYHGTATRRALANSGVPYFVFTHGMLDPWFKRTYPLKHLKKWLFWPWAEYRVLKDARAVLFTCEEEMLCARKSFWLYRANERVVSFGTDCTDLPKSHLTSRFFGTHSTLKNKKLLLFLGRIHEKKGCNLLIEAWAEKCRDRDDTFLLMAGPGEKVLLDQLHILAENLKISTKIVWLGMLKGEDKWAALSAADAFILPSHQENFGMAVAEALSCGTPAFVSNKVNIWREVSTAGAGVVFDDTVAGISEALSTFLSIDQSQRIAMGERARLLYSTKFTLHAMAAGLIDAVLHYQTTK